MLYSPFIFAICQLIATEVLNIINIYKQYYVLQYCIEICFPSTTLKNLLLFFLFLYWRTFNIHGTFPLNNREWELSHILILYWVL